MQRVYRADQFIRATLWQNAREACANLGDLRHARQRVFRTAQGGIHALIQPRAIA
jgi:hypothetical protein